MFDVAINLLVLCGVALIVAGVALVSIPAALVVGGLGLFGLAYALVRVHESRKRI